MIYVKNTLLSVNIYGNIRDAKVIGYDNTGKMAAALMQRNPFMSNVNKNNHE